MGAIDYAGIVSCLIVVLLSLRLLIKKDPSDEDVRNWTIGVMSSWAAFLFFLLAVGILQ